MNSKITAISALILANILWGTTFLATKEMILLSSPLSSVVFRFVLSSVLFMLIGLAIKNDFQTNIVRANFWDMLILSLVSFSFMYVSQAFGLKYISSAQSAVIMMLAPIFLIIFEKFQIRKVNFLDAGIVAMGAAGAILIMSDKVNLELNESSHLGFGLTTIAAFLLGYSIVLVNNIKKKTKSELTTFNLTFFTILFGTLGLFPFYIASDAPTISSLLIKELFGWTIYLSLVCTIFTFYIWNWAVVNSEKTIIAISMYIKTPVAVLLGSYLLNERLTLQFFLGTFLIFLPLFLKSVTKGTN
jgi:drug/metabolite transporter (DMT)-like permease